MSKFDHNNPPSEAIKEARRNPNGYVYKVDEEFKEQKDVPPYAILGFWKVNDRGEIDGPFVFNPNHRSKLS